jgi:PAS domain S-box-containing protein
MMSKRLFGYALDELIGKHVETLAPERFRGPDGSARRLFAAHVQQGANDSTGLVGLTRDGNEFPFEMNIATLQAGTESQIIVTVRDISERKRSQKIAAEKSLKSLHFKETLIELSTQQYEDLDDALDTITRAGTRALATERGGVWTIAGNTLTCASEYRVSLGQYTRGTAVSLAASSRYLAALKEKQTIRVNNARTDLLTRAFNKALLKPFDIYSMLDVPFMIGGQLAGMLCFDHTGGVHEWTDEEEDFARTLAMQITAAMEAEERRRAHADLVIARNTANVANQAKSIFLSNMSHELRTPLNAILGFSHLLEAETEHPLTEEQKHWMRLIHQSGEHLLELVSEILDLARIEAGKVSISVENMPTRELLDETLAVAQALTQKYGVTLIDRSARALPRVYSDRLRTKQILLNLLSNAMKYNRKDGTVWLDVESRANGMLRLSVTDSGYGISLSDQAKLFQPFQRLGAESGPIEGAGIGLVLTKALVEKLDGHIGLESTPGTGSHFWIDLPLAKDQTRVVNPIPAEHPELVPEPASVYNGAASKAACTVLYIEDNPDNMELMAAVVARMPEIDLLQATNAESGLALAAQHLPELILMDMNLPGMSGIEALRELKRDESTRSIHVLAFSADASAETTNRALAAGFNGYLSKPLKPEKLTAAIREGLTHQDKLDNNCSST